MRNLQKKYRRVVVKLSRLYDPEIKSMDAISICDRMETLGFEPLPPTISQDVEVRRWLVEMFYDAPEQRVKSKSRSKKPRTNKKKKRNKIQGFYGTKEWRELRRAIFRLYGKKCLRCGSNKNIHVDHIFPRSRYKHLELDIGNLQPLCADCNELKLNRYYWDYRPIDDEYKLELIHKVGCDDLSITTPPERK